MPFHHRPYSLKLCSCFLVGGNIFSSTGLWFNCFVPATFLGYMHSMHSTKSTMTKRNRNATNCIMLNTAAIAEQQVIGARVAASCPPLGGSEAKVVLERLPVSDKRAAFLQLPCSFRTHE